MRTSPQIFLLGLVIAIFAGSVSRAQIAEAGDPEAGQQLMLSELLRTPLEGVDGKEVIVSHVVLPANTALPRHWHPGEEFAYIVEGSVVLWLEDEGEAVVKKGDASKVPFKKVHSAKSQDDGATILVFRVHESGQPERHLVE
jgi:quercetin dioxygenase-like cupin family protein